MAILKLEEMSRENAVESAFVSGSPGNELEGISFVRRVTPLVVIALNRANNPYITGSRGFEAMGLRVDGENQSSSSDIGLATMPKTAEVLVLFSCSRDDLKKYADNPESLKLAAYDLLENHDVDFFSKATELIANELKIVSKTKAVENPEDEKITPAESEDAGGGKKLDHIG